MANRNAIRESFNDRVFLTILYIILLLIVIVILYPLVHIFVASFSNPNAVIQGEVTIFPVHPTLLAYRALFANHQIYVGFGNTLFYTIVGTMIQVTLTILLAFPLSRKEFVGRKVLMIAMIITMFFEGGMIPTYLIVKDLGILNTRWALIIPKALFVWQVIVTVTFFKSSIPDELYECAQLDGVSDAGFLWRIVMPLSKPIIAVLVLMYAVGDWNSYFDALIYLQSPNLYPLQLVLRNLLVLNKTASLNPSVIYQMRKLQGLSELLKYALIVVTTVPILAIYPFVQKHFVKGVLIGSLKG